MLGFYLEGGHAPRYLTSDMKSKNSDSLKVFWCKKEPQNKTKTTNQLTKTHKKLLIWMTSVKGSITG